MARSSNRSLTSGLGSPDGVWTNCESSNETLELTSGEAVHPDCTCPGNTVVAHMSFEVFQ